jgi:hypothetical protein
MPKTVKDDIIKSVIQYDFMNQVILKTVIADCTFNLNNSNNVREMLLNNQIKFEETHTFKSLKQILTDDENELSLLKSNFCSKLNCALKELKWCYIEKLINDLIKEMSSEIEKLASDRIHNNISKSIKHYNRNSSNNSNSQSSSSRNEDDNNESYYTRKRKVWSEQQIAM